MHKCHSFCLLHAISTILNMAPVVYDITEYGLQATTSPTHQPRPLTSSEQLEQPPEQNPLTDVPHSLPSGQHRVTGIQGKYPHNEAGGRAFSTDSFLWYQWQRCRMS